MEQPPGNWLSPEGRQIKEPIGTNDVVPSQEPLKVPPGSRWKSWSEVPSDPREVARLGPWCVEIFSGTARLTEALLDRGLPCLPPIDVTLCVMVPESFDVVDADRWEFFMQLVFLGAIRYAHFGTPCNTFSAARKEDGGPPPLRDVHHPDGLPSLTGDLWFTTFLGNLFRDRTCEACFVLILLGADFSIENPLSSLIWETPLMISLLCRARAFVCDFDQCAFGAPSQKPTRVMVTHQLLQKALFRRCPGLSSTHRHEVLKGKVYSAQFGRVVYRTKLAQVYPHDMCQAMASAVAMMVQDPWSHLSPSFQLKGKANDRKRPLGQEVAWKMHRQHKTALAAVAAGYQMKRGAMKPLLEVECEPGQAIEWVMKIPHPFSVTDPLPEQLRRAILQVADAPDQRQDLKSQDVVSLETLHEKAWDIRRKIVSRVQGVPISENLVKLWESTMEDVQEGSCVGPLGSEQEVSDLLKVDDWIPTQRFEVVQKNKVRGCDSATTNLINRATVITEKLQLPSTDTNVAALRALRSEAPLQQLGGWVLDEKKAYRQVPIRPDQRKFSVIALKNPFSGVPSFFVMVGHSFGLVSAVYNYNRRSAAINEFLVSLFGLVAFSFYDDKYGFEPLSTVQSAHEVAQQVHWWLGAHFDQKKLQLARDPTILGVTYNLIEMTLEIKESRKKDLLEEMDSILESKLLDPGTAGKLKGKLLWGKVGRAFLRSISERQYARFALQDGFKLDQALEVSLRHWKKLISEGPPRPIELMHQKISDAVIFTDGFTPDPRSKERSPSMVGAVLFDRRMSSPLQLSEVVPRSMEEKWLPRKTQIVPVEMLAPILALQTFYDRLRGADIILLIDSEAVEAALIKGYSSKEDLCSLVSVFWDLVFELRARVFIDRVATDANPSDMPSRGDVRTGEAVGWRTVKAVWPRALLGNRP